MLLRHIRIFSRKYSTLSEPIQKLDDFRTNELNTNNHSYNHIGRFYKISSDDKKQLFSHGGLPKSFEKQVKTFGETCLMIRKPAIEIMNYMKNFDMQNKPALRFVLYGDDGVGKSLTMAHILHFALQNNFIIVHVPWAANWYKKPKELADSQTYEGYTDLPFDAAAWLLHFKAQNTSILSKYDLKLSQDYVWSKRETTPANSTLLELVEHGIARIKFASDTIQALVNELKLHSTNGKCKVLVAIDGFNAFFHPTTRIFGPHKIRITPDKITMTKPFLDITNYNWCNGVCLLTVDKIASTEEKQDSFLPKYLLGKDGFEHLDPFIPIRVDNYNEKEIQSCIDYYVNRKWIQNVGPGFETELRYLSANNPYRLMNVCAPL